MRVAVLGNSGMFPGPGKACSGYLVMEGETRILLDCGTGVFANVQKHLPVGALTGIVISHMHPDHFIDLVPLRYALVYGDPAHAGPLPVYLPPGGEEIWRQMVAPFGEPGNAFSAPFDIREYQEGTDYRLGGLSIRVGLLRHYVPNYGIEVHGQSKLVYSGDTAPCEALLKVARQADLLICEATWLEDAAPPAKRGHLTAKEVGEFAEEAGVHQLLLTHISKDVDPQQSLSAARAVFNGEVRLAQEDQTYTVEH